MAATIVGDVPISNRKAAWAGLHADPHGTVISRSPAPCIILGSTGLTRLQEAIPAAGVDHSPTSLNITPSLCSRLVLQRSSPAASRARPRRLQNPFQHEG